MNLDPEIVPPPARAAKGFPARSGRPPARLRPRPETVKKRGTLPGTMVPPAGTPVRFFETRERLRAWFERNHDRATELWIGYYKVGTGRKGVTYDEAVEEALCFGWIDGLVRSLDAVSYTNRYTPRRRGSPWSRLNVAKVGALRRSGRMHEAGIRAFRARVDARPAGYSFEEPPRDFSPPLRRKFESNVPAWKFFERQPPSYRRTAAFWVMSARRETTRIRRLGVLLEASAQGRRLDTLSPARPRISRWLSERPRIAAGRVPPAAHARRRRGRTGAGATAGSHRSRNFLEIGGR
jgi:uncharacterized protein YdeI (YjbR/CyaY-like superfamily)